MVDPTNVFAMDDIKFMTGFNIEPVVASESAILDGIEKSYSTVEPERKDDLEADRRPSCRRSGKAERLNCRRRGGNRHSPSWRRRPKKRPIIKLVN